MRFFLFLSTLKRFKFLYTSRASIFFTNNIVIIFYTFKEEAKKFGDHKYKISYIMTRKKCTWYDKQEKLNSHTLLLENDEGNFFKGANRWGGDFFWRAGIGRWAFMIGNFEIHIIKLIFPKCQPNIQIKNK